MLERIPELDFKLVVSGMQISKEIGGNLAETLERLSDTLRRKLEMEGKIDALTGQGKCKDCNDSIASIYRLYFVSYGAYTYDATIY
ncbi:type II secretion system F family protein [Pseudoalteromonas espejiana]